MSDQKSTKEQIQEFLTAKGIKFHPKLGEKKLMLLLEADAVENTEAKELLESIKGVPPSAEELTKQGKFDEARELVKAMELEDEDENKYLAIIEAAELEAKAKAKAKKPKKDKNIRPARKEKLVTDAEILKDWGKLYDKMSRREAQQRIAKGPFRHLLIARNRMKRNLLSFKMNCR